MSSLIPTDLVTLGELFAKQPSTLTEADRKAIVEALRAARTKYSEARQEARLTGKRIKKKSGLSMKDLGIDQSSLDDFLKEAFGEGSSDE